MSQTYTNFVAINLLDVFFLFLIFIDFVRPIILELCNSIGHLLDSKLRKGLIKV